MPSREEIANWIREVEQEYKQLANDIKGPFNEPILKAQIKWGKRAKQVDNMRCENCNSKDELLKEMAEALTNLLANPKSVNGWVEAAQSLQKYHEQEAANGE